MFELISRHKFLTIAVAVALAASALPALAQNGLLPGFSPPRGRAVGLGGTNPGLEKALRANDDTDCADCLDAIGSDDDSDTACTDELEPCPDTDDDSDTACIDDYNDTDDDSRTTAPPSRGVDDEEDDADEIERGKPEIVPPGPPAGKPDSIRELEKREVDD